MWYHTRVENGRQLLELKSDGLIILNTTVDTGKDNMYYLVDDKGNRTTIKEIPDFKGLTNKVPAIVVGPVSVPTQYVTNDNSTITTTSGGTVYRNFELYNKDNKDIRDKKCCQKSDSSINAAVNECRVSQLSSR